MANKQRSGSVGELTLDGVTQRRISEVESADVLHTEYGTLARYVDALGGRLELVADFGNRTVTVR